MATSGGKTTKRLQIRRKRLDLFEEGRQDAFMEVLLSYKIGQYPKRLT
jgi:hypothetical protein